MSAAPQTGPNETKAAPSAGETDVFGTGVTSPGPDGESQAAEPAESTAPSRRPAGPGPARPSPKVRQGGGLARLRDDLRALEVSAARPRDTLIALAAVALLLGAGVAALGRMGAPVDRLEGVAQSVTSLRWQDDAVLELGTAGTGVVRWQASGDSVQADADPDRAGRTVLSLPPMQSGAVYAERPAVTLWSSVPELQPDMLGTAQDLLRSEGRLPLLQFRLAADDPNAAPNLVPYRLDSGTDAVLRNDPTGFTAMTVSPDGQVTFTGDVSGGVQAQQLLSYSLQSEAPARLDLYDFGLARDTGDGLVQPAAVVALAAAGTGEGARLAAASSDGRIVALRAVDAAKQSPEALPLRNMEAVAAGLPQPALWAEPVDVAGVLGAGIGEGLLPLGFSRDGGAILLHDTGGNRLIQAEIGGQALVALPLAPGGVAAPPDPAELGDALTDLPLLTNATARLLLGGLPVAAASDAGGAADPAVYRALRKAVPWKLPLDLLQGDVALPLLSRASFGRPGAARDPESGRVALWTGRGVVFVLTPGVEKLGASFGNGQPVADAAFEPGSGALVILYADGTARRWTPGPGAPSNLRFAPPAYADGGPPGEALALSFPPGEMVTLVQWSRTATAPSILRRYDRASAAPLGPGLDIGFDTFFLPDRSNLLVTSLDGWDVRIRDARNGATVVDAVFEGSVVRLAPSSDGQNLGVVIRDDKVWTLRLAPTGGGTPPPVPDDLADALSAAPLIAVPLPVPVVRDGLALSADGNTLLARTRDGGLYAARPADAAGDCCIALRRILPGVVALRALLSPDGSQALVAGADHILWRVALDGGDVAVPLVQLAGPVRSLALSPDGRRLAVAAEGAAPLVVTLGMAARLAALPVIGHAPHVRPAPLAAREMPPAALSAGQGVDAILVGRFRRLSDAVALRDAVRTTLPGLRILQNGAVYDVIADLGAEDARDMATLRKALARARMAAPGTRGAALVALAALCRGPVAAGAVPPVDLRCGAGGPTAN